MIHDESGLAEFLEGELDEVETAAWDDHLLACEDCWTAVEESRCGRALAASLREAAPRELRARVQLAVGVAAGRRPRQRVPRTVGAAASVAAAVAAVAVAILVGVDRGGDAVHDPPAIATVLRLAADDTQSPPRAENGVVITRLRVNGTDVVLARSEHLFPMPEGAIALADDPQSPWLARRGDVNLLCFSHPAPMLLAGRVSPQTLTEVAAALGIPASGRNQDGPAGVPLG